VLSFSFSGFSLFTLPPLSAIVTFPVFQLDSCCVLLIDVCWLTCDSLFLFFTFSFLLISLTRKRYLLSFFSPSFFYLPVFECSNKSRFLHSELIAQLFPCLLLCSYLAAISDFLSARKRTAWFSPLFLPPSFVSFLPLASLSFSDFASSIDTLLYYFFFIISFSPVLSFPPNTDRSALSWHISPAPRPQSDSFVFTILWIGLPRIKRFFF